MKHVEKIIAIAILLFAIGFNLWTYRLEPTAKTDPNDNTFQYALVDRTNQIWDFAQQKCSGVTKPFCVFSYLSDHWVPNWAQGYNLPYYYSHIPQITIVASYRFFHWSIGSIGQIGSMSLFQYYHYVIYLLLCLFPLSLFLALRIIGLSWITAGLGALIASHLSTDGLYGLDPASFLWRGYGLSSQLFAMIWLPLAIAYAFKYFEDIRFRNKDLGIHTIPSYFLHLKSSLPAIIFLTATTAGHLGIGIIAFISIGVLALAEPINLLVQNNLSTNRREVFTALWRTISRLLPLYGGVLLLLGYWIIPILFGGNYHNISVWDPIWKFDSYGYREVLKNLFNGDLFDFGRFPILTVLVGIGLYSAVSGKIVAAARLQTPERSDGGQGFLQHNYLSFGILFIFWLLFYFGRTTWGGLINLIPSMEEFHLSRFIVGLHITGLFLIPIAIQQIIEIIWRDGTKFLQIASRAQHTNLYSGQNLRAAEQKNFWYVVSQILTTTLILVILIFSVYPQTIRYATHNDRLITQANANFEKIEPDAALLLSTINNLQLTNSGRVYAGRGGSWGKNFRVAETPMYMYISTFGIPTLTWLPETWSPNSDTEQYFSEDVADHYMLYTIKYVVTPADLPKDKIQPFWKPLTTGKTWRLYNVDDPAPHSLGEVGYITSGLRPAIVSSSKMNFTNVVRLWIQSDIHTKNLYPELTFDTNYPKTAGLPNFRMLDEVTYKVPDASTHTLFAEAPSYQATQTNNVPSITSQSNDNDMTFTATVNVPDGCTECIVILHQTYHPSWTATIDGKQVKTFAVFPFYTAVKIENTGVHEVVFSYQPSHLKQFLLIIAFITFGVLFCLTCPIDLNNFKTTL